MTHLLCTPSMAREQLGEAPARNALSTLRTPRPGQRAPATPQKRSEEHTSELQSRSDLVCRLLLEKKKTTRANGHQLKPDAFSQRYSEPVGRSNVNPVLIRFLLAQVGRMLCSRFTTEMKLDQECLRGLRNTPASNPKIFDLNLFAI